MRLRPTPKIKVTFRTVNPEEHQGMEIIYLGKVIGTCSGWDQSGDQELVFYDYTPNILGKKCLQMTHISGEESIYDSISINTETGNVTLYLRDVEIPIEVDWSVFNREKGESSDKK